MESFVWMGKADTPVQGRLPRRLVATIWPADINQVGNDPGPAYMLLLIRKWSTQWAQSSCSVPEVPPMAAKSQA